MSEMPAERSAAAAGTVSLGGHYSVNRMGYGAMRITGPGVWGPPENPTEAIAVLRRAVELGVNFIDTADAYGPETSEELIAEALHPYPADLVVGTKGGLIRSGPGRWEADGRPEHLREALEASLRRLKVERVQLYQFHTVDPAVPLEESIGSLKDLQDEGKIELIGVCNFGREQLAVAEGIAEIVSVQNRYNLADRASEQVLDRCVEEGQAFLPWFPLGAGSLDGARTALASVAQKHSATTFQVALAWLLHRSHVMLVIPGTSTVAHLEENIAAASIRLDADDMKDLGSSN